MARPEKFRLGEILVQQNLLSQEQLQQALDEQKKTGRKLGRVFVDKGFVTEEQISEAIARQINAPYINLKYFNIKPATVRLLPEAQARRFRALVLEERDNAIRVGFADPTDLFAYDEVARILKREIELAVVTESQLLETVDRVYQRTQEIGDAAAFLGFDGILAPSARWPCQNLVLFTEHFTPADLSIVSSEPVDWDDWRKRRNTERQHRDGKSGSQ